jgi:hypothetical protein
MQKFILSVLISLSLFSCKKSETTQADPIAGQWKWVIQRENNPAYFSTPATTGIQETLEFNTNGTYTVTQNSVTVNSGTYKTVIATSTNGSPVSGVLYSNTRVTDSVVYYVVRNNNDSLMFCHDLIGTLGASSRIYGK